MQHECDSNEKSHMLWEKCGINVVFFLMFVLCCLLHICIMETQVSSGELKVNSTFMWTKMTSLLNSHSQYDQRLRTRNWWILSI